VFVCEFVSVYSKFVVSESLRAQDVNVSVCVSVCVCV
jgi:hypothetical protein